jgi:hypothetical protein
MHDLPTVDELAQRDVAELRARISVALISLGWDRLLGKQRGGEQTLLEHCLAVVDVLCACAPLFAAETRPSLTSDEFLGILVAAVAHDAGKADPGFQAYLRGEHTSFAEHVSAEHIRSTILHVARALDMRAVHVEDIVSEAVLHDRRMRRDRGELIEWSRIHESPRWRKLADFVNHADSVASAEDVFAAESFLLRNSLLIGAAKVACYYVHLRGVSTTFLHEASLEAFTAATFRPIAYFAEGTLFAGPEAPPPREAIATRLRAKIENLFTNRREQVPELAVGGPTEDFLPRPEYVRRDAIGELLRVASGRVRRKAPPATPKQMTDRYKELTKWKEQWGKRKELGGEPSDAELQALLDIGPEACVFKIAKEIVKKVLGDPQDVQNAKSLYENRFGAGSFDSLTSQSTFMPVQDYALCVRTWHRSMRDGHRVGQLDPAKRLAMLIEELEQVLRAALGAAVAPLPSDRLTEDWTDRIMPDLALEAVPPRRETIERQFEGYVALKSSPRGKRKPAQQCAQCAALIEPGESERGSAALDNKGSYSNRRLAFDHEGQPPLCRTCVADLELAQLCLGRPVKTVIGLVPRRSLGAQGALELVRRVRQLRTRLDRQLSPETADPASYVAMTLPQQALRAESISAALIRPVSNAKQQGRTKELASALKEKLGDAGLGELNEDHGTAFESAEALAGALVAGRAPEAIRKDPDVREAVTGILGGGRVDFAAITPNLIIVSLDRELGVKKDSDADRALYSFGLATLFAHELEMACLLAPVAEVRTALAGRAGRTVYVPANGPARRLLGADWLGMEDSARWLRAVRAAIVLGEHAGANTVLEVLRYPSAGYAIRRIEQQPESKPIGPALWPFVEALKEVLG